MEEAPAQPMEKSGEQHGHEDPAAAGKPIIHRVCEACNNMFVSYAGSKHMRCPKCTKE